MVEIAYNRGPFIDSANRKYAYIGAPYCASSVSLILDRSKPTSPTKRSGRAKAHISENSVDARRVWEGKDTVPYNSLVIFTRKGGGHIEFHISTKGDVLRCFGFNTSPDGKAGSQWNGTWSGYKNRSIKKLCSPYNVFRITHFTPVTYESDNKGHNSCPVNHPASYSPVAHMRQLHPQPYNRFRYDGSGAANRSPARYSLPRSRKG